MSPWPTQELEGYPPAILPPVIKIIILFPALRVITYRPECIAVFASEAFAIVLYPVELTMEPKIEQEGMARILHYLLQAIARASKAILCRRDCNLPALAIPQILRTRNTPCPPTGPRAVNLAMKKSPMPVAVSFNLEIRSPEYHAFRGPTSPGLFSLLSLPSVL